MNYKNYFKNTLLESLYFSEELRRFRTPAAAAAFRKQRGLPEPERREMLGDISTDRGNRRNNPYSMPMNLQSSDEVEVNPDMARLTPVTRRNNPDPIPTPISTEGEHWEAKMKKLRNERLLATVHFFSRLGHMLTPEDIEGIDFATGHTGRHIDTIARRLEGR